MKTRSKLLLAAVSLLTVSVAATATSAYAWYTANKQVSAKLTSMGVQATSGTLSISHPSESEIKDSFSSENFTTSTTSNLVANAEGKALTDVSSKGDGTFIKPKFGHDNKEIVGEYDKTKGGIGQETVTLSNGVTGSSASTKISAYGVISLAIKIENSGKSGAAGAIDVYIDPTKTSLTSTLASAQNSARFSIIEVGSPNKVYMYCSPTAVSETPTASSETPSETQTADAKTGYKYLEKVTENEKEVIKEAKLTETDNDKFIQDKASDKLFAKTGVVASSGEGTRNKLNGYLCTLDAQTNKTYLITMWVEGTDPDCKVDTELGDSVLISDLSLNLGLYALEA